MRNYKKIHQRQKVKNFVRTREAFTKKTPEEEAEKISKIINTLKGESFKNKETRKELSKMIYAICHSKDPEARKVAKYIGDMMTDYAKTSETETDTKKDENFKISIQRQKQTDNEKNENYEVKPRYKGFKG